MNNKKLGIFLLVGSCVGIILLTIAFFMWLKPTTPSPVPSQAVSSVTPTLSPLSSPSGVASSDKLPALPRSLQGTNVDGEIIIDENKNLVVTRGLRRLFDYFLSAQGEETLETINQRVEDYIRKHTPEPAASQAIALYKKYVQYLTEISTIEKQYVLPQPTNGDNPKLDLELIKKRQIAVTTLQKRLFDDTTIKAFFGEQTALDTYTITAMAIQKDPNLTPEQKAQAQASAKQQYLNTFDSPELKNQLAQQDNIEKLLEETQKLKAQGASQEELNAMRRQYVDEKAVQRLENLDKTEQSFDSKFTAYQQQRETILATQGNTPQAQQAIAQLQKQNFTELEIKRLDGYESLRKSQNTK